MAEVISKTTEYPTMNNQTYSQPFDASNSKTGTSVFIFTRIHALVLMGVMLVCTVLIAFNLIMQQKTAEAEIAVRNYESEISTLQTHTDTIYTKISDQYNYEIIKEAAKEGNLNIDSSRVRSVE